MILKIKEEKCGSRENVAVILECSNACPFLWRRNVFGCTMCPYNSYDFAIFRQHYKIHFNKREVLKKARSPLNVKVDVSDLKCTICDDDATDINVLVDHLIAKHNKNIHRGLGIGLQPFLLMDGFRCPNCPSSFDNFLGLSEHSNVHYPHFACAECGKAFSNQSNLRNHLETHEKPAEVICPRCDEAFPSKSRLRIHARHVHNLLPYKCPYCQMTFQEYAHRVRHMTEYHGHVITYPCSLCSMVCVSSGARSKHVRRKHNTERQFLCSTCGDVFITKTELKMHCMVKHQKSLLIYLTG